MIEPNLAAMMAVQNAAAATRLSRAPFENRGFSAKVIEALIAAGIDYTERLLFIDEKAIGKLPGVGPKRVRELKAYVLKFRESPWPAIPTNVS